MDTTTYIALSRQVALQRQMEVIANNVANVATAGFKGSTMVFASVLERAGEPGHVAFVQDLGIVRDDEDGPVTTTGAPLDLALQGPGWFSIGTGDGVRYTRAGSFALNDAGMIVTAAGDPVLDTGGSPLVIPQGSGAPAIAGDGTVTAGGLVIGRIGTVEFRAPGRLAAERDGLYRAEEAPAPAATTRLVQGALEGSTVNGVVEMTRLIQTQRAFEATHRLIETSHDLGRRAIETMLSVRA